MNEGRIFIPGSEIRLEDTRAVVLSGLPMAQWGDPSKVPAGNEELRKIADEYISAFQGTQGAQAIAKKILADYRVGDGTMTFYVPLNPEGKKAQLPALEAWVQRDLHMFTTDTQQDIQQLSIWLRNPLKTYMENTHHVPASSQSSGSLPESSPSVAGQRPAADATIKTPTNIMCKRLQDEARSFEGTLEELKTKVFNDRDWEYGCLKDLEDAQDRTDKEVWAREWAEKLRQKDQDAMDHNDRRRALLFFLRTVCDLGLTKQGEIKEGQLDALKSLAHILTRIYYVCLPMDRANALYCLFNTETHGPGQHWYAEEHTQLMMDTGVIPHDFKDKHNMNRRYLAMLRSEIISEFDRNRLTRFLTPTLCPLIALDEGIIAQAKAAGVLDVRLLVPDPYPDPDQLDPNFDWQQFDGDSPEQGRKRSRV